MRTILHAENKTTVMVKSEEEYQKAYEKGYRESPACFTPEGKEQEKKRAMEKAEEAKRVARAAAAEDCLRAFEAGEIVKKDERMAQAFECLEKFETGILVRSRNRKPKETPT